MKGNISFQSCLNMCVFDSETNQRRKLRDSSSRNNVKRIIPCFKDMYRRKRCISIYSLVSIFSILHFPYEHKCVWWCTIFRDECWSILNFACGLVKDIQTTCWIIKPNGKRYRLKREIIEKWQHANRWTRIHNIFCDDTWK